MTMPRTRDLLGVPRGRLHHLTERLRAMGPKRIAALVERHEAWGTDPWAVTRLFEVELFTQAILEPGAGLGNIAQEATRRGYGVVAWDIFPWGFPLARVGDFLKSTRADLPLGWRAGRIEFSVVCNPPFSKTAAFVAHALALGARKVAAFQKMEFAGSLARRPWLASNPPSRIWLCGTRATCWRFDVPPEKRNGSTPTQHACFVWERGHAPAPPLRNIWETE